MGRTAIESVECFIFKDRQRGLFSESDAETGDDAPVSDYYINDWGRAESEILEAALVKVTTEGGIHGWGEIMAPLVPEAGAALVERLFGPLVLGEDALEAERIHNRLYESMHIRGHWAGFMMDALSAIDVACWDIKGKVHDAPVSTLLGGRERETLPAYASTYWAETSDEQSELASQHLAEGFEAVKVYSGRRDRGEERAAIERIREAVGPDARILSELYWDYSVHEAIRVGKDLAALDVEWIEAPLAPEDVEGHASVADRVDTAVAVGESLRTARQFRRWFDAGAIDVAQPDVVRIGLTEGKRIADLAHQYHKPVAPHLSSALGIGIAATWHLSSALPNFAIQEHQPRTFQATNEFLDPGLTRSAEGLHVPTEAGLGVDIDEDAIAPFVVEHTTVEA